jgi:hypothetical protein
VVFGEVVGNASLKAVYSIEAAGSDRQPKPTIVEAGAKDGKVTEGEFF